MGSRIGGAVHAAPPLPRLDALAAEIAEEMARVDEGQATALQHAIAAGAKLTEAKSLVKHGEWLRWLKVNFPATKRAATNYMRLKSNEQHVAHLGSVREALSVVSRLEREKGGPRPQRKRSTPQFKSLLTPEVITLIKRGVAREELAERVFKNPKGTGLRQAQDAIKEYKIRQDERARHTAPSKRKATEGGKRLRQLHADKRAGERDAESVAWQLQRAIAEAVSELERFDLPDMEWSDDVNAALHDIVHDLERHRAWNDRAVDVVWAHMDDVGRQRKLNELRKRGDDPSSTLNERKTAVELADKLERKYREQRELGP